MSQIEPDTIRVIAVAYNDDLPDGQLRILFAKSGKKLTLPETVCNSAQSPEDCIADMLRGKGFESYEKGIRCILLKNSDVRCVVNLKVNVTIAGHSRQDFVFLTIQELIGCLFGVGIYTLSDLWSVLEALFSFGGKAVSV